LTFIQWGEPMTNLTPIDWAKRPLQKYADFSGRAPRAEYWWFTLAVVVVLVVVSIIEDIVGLGGMIFGAYGPLSGLFYLAILLPSIAVGVRRLHDTNRPGWWMLPTIVFYAAAFLVGGRDMMERSPTPAMALAGILILIGAVFGLVLLIFYCLAGTRGDNRYGPDPYAGEA